MVRVYAFSKLYKIYCMKIPQFIYFTIDRHLDGLQLLAITNSATI